MKLSIHLSTIMGRKLGTIEIDDTATVRELKQRMGRLLLEQRFYGDDLTETVNLIGKITLSLPVTESTGDFCHGRIYIDTPAEVTIKSLFPEGTNFTQPITASFPNALCDPYPHERTSSNPKGARLYAFSTEDKQGRLFKSVQDPHQGMSFRQRLEIINYGGDIPNEYLDPVTQELMNNPIVANDGHIYDLDTFKRLKTSPFTREPLRMRDHALGLWHKIDKFVSQHESAQQAHGPSHN
jgi:hypothetical protein